MSKALAPKDLVIKRSSPPIPPPLPTNNAIIGNAPDNNRIVKTSQQIQSDIKNSLINEAQDLQRTHNQLLTLLGTEETPLLTLGTILSSTLSNLSPQGSAIFSPIIQDFRAQTLGYLNYTSNNTDTEIYPGFIENISDTLINLTSEETQCLVSGLKTALLFKNQNNQVSNIQNSKCLNDAINGYSPLINTLANTSELIGSSQPRTWHDLSKSTPDNISQLLNLAHKEIFSSYAESSAQAIAIHVITRDYLEKNQRCNNELKISTALLAAVTAGVNSSNISTQATQSLMKSAALSIVKNDIIPALTKLLSTPNKSAPMMSKSTPVNNITTNVTYV